MQKPNQDESINLLASLRAVAGQHDDIHERAMFGCPEFFAGTAMVAWRVWRPDSTQAACGPRHRASADAGLLVLQAI
jgi:hypothetical protein